MGPRGGGRWRTTTGINAQVRPGAQIAGHVAEQGTGASLARVEVCILDPAPNPRAEEFERCAFTDAAGNYAVRSLRAGIFSVVFSRDGGRPKPTPSPSNGGTGYRGGCRHPDLHCSARNSYRHRRRFDRLPHLAQTQVTAPLS
jgi:hypothetical protein